MRESDRKFFKPLWRRVVVTVFCAAWAGWEWFNDEQLWAMLVGGLALYCVWFFILKFDADGEAGP